MKNHQLSDISNRKLWASPRQLQQNYIIFNTLKDATAHLTNDLPLKRNTFMMQSTSSGKKILAYTFSHKHTHTQMHMIRPWWMINTTEETEHGTYILSYLACDVFLYLMVTLQVKLHSFGCNQTYDPSLDYEINKLNNISFLLIT